MSSPPPPRYLHVNGKKCKLGLSADVSALTTYLNENLGGPLVLADSAGILAWRGVVGDYVGDFFVEFLNSPAGGQRNVPPDAKPAQAQQEAGSAGTGSAEVASGVVEEYDEESEGSEESSLSDISTEGSEGSSYSDISTSKACMVRDGRCICCGFERPLVAAHLVEEKELQPLCHGTEPETDARIMRFLHPFHLLDIDDVQNLVSLCDACNLLFNEDGHYSIGIEPDSLRLVVGNRARKRETNLIDENGQRMLYEQLHGREVTFSTWYLRPSAEILHHRWSTFLRHQVERRFIPGQPVPVVTQHFYCRDCPAIFGSQDEQQSHRCSATYWDPLFLQAVGRRVIEAATAPHADPLLLPALMRLVANSAPESVPRSLSQVPARGPSSSTPTAGAGAAATSQTSFNSSRPRAFSPALRESVRLPSSVVEDSLLLLLEELRLDPHWYNKVPRGILSRDT